MWVGRYATEDRAEGRRRGRQNKTTASSYQSAHPSSHRNFVQKVLNEKAASRREQDGRSFLLQTTGKQSKTGYGGSWALRRKPLVCVFVELEPRGKNW
jgi:hypothetical protein